jgi:hypothetical protein
MYYRGKLRSSRERIVTAEVRKLELRRMQQQPGDPYQRTVRQTRDGVSAHRGW